MPVVSQTGVSYKFVKEKPKTWFELDELKKSTYMAFVISEDWSFFEHPGVDVEQVKIAISDYLEGKKLRGASTISQQVVKNLFYSHERSLERKFKELLTTFYLEKYLTKNEILEIYLNIIQFGDKLYGIGPATEFYFEKEADELKVNEAAYLAMLLPSPVRYSQSFFEQKVSEYGRSTINSILHKLSVVKVVKKSELKALQSEPLVFESQGVVDLILQQLQEL